jgi:hypothetical protein
MGDQVNPFHPTDHLINLIEKQADTPAWLKSEIDLLRLELETRNYACGDALDLLWRDIVYARRGEDYGSWEYAAQAYRHIMAEFNELKNERDQLLALTRAWEAQSDMRDSEKGTL